MKRLNTLILAICATLYAIAAAAQKPFSEGVVIYNVVLSAPEQNVTIHGTYTYTFKGQQLKKELKLENGYEDITLFDVGNNTAYTLQSREGRKFAIELRIEDIMAKQDRYRGYNMANEQTTSNKIAGLAAYKGQIVYKNGSTCDVLYSKEWRPAALTFNRFPEAQFIPLRFTIAEDNGMTMQFEADKIEACPVESATFRIPTEYKMISYDEYKELSK